MRFIHDGITHWFYTRQEQFWLAEWREEQYCKKIFWRVIYPFCLFYDRQNDMVSSWIFRLSWGPGLVIVFLLFSGDVFGYTFTLENYWTDWNLFINTAYALKLAAKEYICTMAHMIHHFLQILFLPIANDMYIMYISYNFYNFW